MYPLPPLTHTSYVLPATGRRLQSNLPKGGLSLQRLIQPLAGMAMREPEADHQIELIGSCTKTALSGPDLSDHFRLLSIDLLTHSSLWTRYTAHCARAFVAAGGTVVLLFRDHGPKTTGHFVRQCNGDAHAGFALQHAYQPTVVRRSKALDGLKNGHSLPGSACLHACEGRRKPAACTCPVAHLRSLTKPWFAACRVLFRNQSQPNCKIPASAKAVQIGRKALHCLGCDWPRTWHGLGPPRRFNDGFSVSDTVLLSFYKRLHTVWCNQSHRMAELLNLAAPAMGCSTRLRCNNARGLLAHKRKTLNTRQFLAKNNCSVSTRPVTLKHAGCKVCTDHRNF
jgi:hypothetical protein